MVQYNMAGGQQDGELGERRQREGTDFMLTFLPSQEQGPGLRCWGELRDRYRLLFFARLQVELLGTPKIQIDAHASCSFGSSTLGSCGPVQWAAVDHA